MYIATQPPPASYSSTDASR